MGGGISRTCLNDEENITIWVSHTEYARSRQTGHASLIEMIIQHVLNVRWVAVEVKSLRYLLLFFSIIQSHDSKDWLNVQVEPRGEELPLCASTNTTLTSIPTLSRGDEDLVLLLEAMLESYFPWHLFYQEVDTSQRVMDAGYWLFWIYFQNQHPSRRGIPGNPTTESLILLPPSYSPP